MGSGQVLWVLHRHIFRNSLWEMGENNIKSKSPNFLQYQKLLGKIINYCNVDIDIGRLTTFYSL